MADETKQTADTQPEQDVRESELQKTADILQMPPVPLHPEKRTWRDYFARTARDMLLEALEYVDKAVENPEELRAIVMLYNPSDLNNPSNLLAGTNSFEVHMDRAKATDAEVVFMARYLEQDVWLHYIGVRERLMTSDETADYGRLLMESLRVAGVGDIVAGLMMAGYAMACLVAKSESPPDLEDVLPVAISPLKTPPTFQHPPPVKN